MAKTILFIEDEFALQKTVGDYLQTQGYQLISAMDGEEGIRMVTEKKPDLILLDLILPKKNGFDVLQAVKLNEQTKAIPVIVLTNLSEMGDIDRVLELGATTYLVKSDHTLSDILDKIKLTLGGE